jgi:hypothetical protein
VDFMPQNERVSAAPGKLIFNKQQLAESIAWLKGLGATRLASALAQYDEATPEDLAHVISQTSSYSLAEQEFNERQANFHDFVKNGSFQVQCRMAARVLKEMLVRAMSQHPLRERVTFHPIDTFGKSEIVDNSVELHLPGHETLEYGIDGVPAGILDATPASRSLPKPERTNIADEKKARAIADLPRQLAAYQKARDQMIEALKVIGKKAIPADLPHTAINASLSQIAKLAEGLIEGHSFDEQTFRLGLRSYLGSDIDTLPLDQVFVRLDAQLSIWTSRLDSLAALLNNDADRKLIKLAAQQGIDLLLSDYVTRPLKQSADHGQDLLRSCQDYLLSRRTNAVVQH